ncbi:MAG: hypothetical protein ABIG29_00675 [Candidatus Nealsonbacteria bacterium]
MSKQVSPKIVALAFGILVISFAVAFYVVAWTEPTSSPPLDNVATPLNISSAGQIKTGNLVVNALGISGASGDLFSMPAGAGTGKVLTSDASGLGTWQTTGVGIPSGMIAMFDTSCPDGWTRFAALDNKFPYGGASYGATGGVSTHAHTYEVPAGFGSFMYGPASVTFMAGSSYKNTDPATIVGGWYYQQRTTGSGTNLPPYVTVVWCKKN